jgi:protocatechuate 3,4-dioxygenase beta subunit
VFFWMVGIASGFLSGRGPQRTSPASSQQPPRSIVDAVRMPTDHARPRRALLRRREALTALGGIGLTGMIGGAAGVLGAVGGVTDAGAASSCVLTPEVTEGPYWIQNSLTRHDIREGRPGLPLDLVFTVQNAKTCTAIAGADVEVWHCDAGGVYSGVQGDRGHFLRGHQKTGATGVASFLTLYPGWYRGRTPHIHLKVHVGGSVVHTGQVFFDERTTALVYKIAPYKSHGQPDTTHAQDGIFAQAGRTKAQLALTKRTQGQRGYRGAITLGVATG